MPSPNKPGLYGKRAADLTKEEMDSLSENELKFFAYREAWYDFLKESSVVNERDPNANS